MKSRIEFILPEPHPSPVVVDMTAIPRVGEYVQFRVTEPPLKVSQVVHLPHDVRQNATVRLESIL